MVVDPCRHHRLRVSRPDLSVTLGTPNACTSSHTNRDARWAGALVNEWYGPKELSATHERVAHRGDTAMAMHAIVANVM